MSTEPSPSERQLSDSVIRSILAIVFARLVINVSKRFAYPFVSAIGGAFSVSADSVQNVIALTNGAGLASPLLGTVSERYGRKTVMVCSLLMMTVMALLGALFAHWGIFVLVMFSLGVGKIIFDPTFQAYLGDIIPFGRRARVMGIAELSWALSLVVAAPVTGYLLDASSLQAVFLFLSVMLGLGTLALLLLVEADSRPDQHQRINIISPLAAIRKVSSQPSALFALVFSIGLTISHEVFFINYGLWMQGAFDLVLTALGTLTILIAIAEVIGEFIVITLADRIGAKRTAVTGLVVGGILIAVIPHLSFSLPLAMLGIFAMFICVEASIVASLPLFTEILPDARAVMMSANMGAHSLGRVLGAALGAYLYKASGGDFMLIGALAGAVGLLAALALFVGVPASGRKQKTP